MSTFPLPSLPQPPCPCSYHARSFQSITYLRLSHPIFIFPFFSLIPLINPPSLVTASTSKASKLVLSKASDLWTITINQPMPFQIAADWVTVALLSNSSFNPHFYNNGNKRKDELREWHAYHHTTILNQCTETRITVTAWLLHNCTVAKPSLTIPQSQCCPQPFNLNPIKHTKFDFSLSSSIWLDKNKRVAKTAITMTTSEFHTVAHPSITLPQSRCHLQPFNLLIKQ